MDKPARRVVTAVETGPEQPATPSPFILDPVVVADRVPATGWGRAKRADQRFDFTTLISVATGSRSAPIGTRFGAE
jgi:hypothetical protein